MAKKQNQQINSWQEADELLKQVGALTIEIQRAEGIANTAIETANAKLEETAKPLQEKIKLLTKQLKNFAVKNRKDFGDAQSRKLNFGIVGWRKSSSLDTKLTTTELIRRVFGKDGEKYIRPAAESVNKETLDELTDAELKKVNAVRNYKEPFFADPCLKISIDYEKNE